MSGRWKGVLASQGTISVCTFRSYCVSAGDWIQGWRGFTCGVGFMGRQCQVRLEDLTS